MNWMGGVRRRVLQKDEVRRRQDIFFSAHALPNQKPSSGVPAEGQHDTSRTHPTARPSSGPMACRNRISPRKWRSDSMVCERLKRGQGWDNYSTFIQKKKQSGSGFNHATDLQLAKKGHTKAAIKTKTTLPPVRPASIHGPFSRYLLKLELQSVGLKLDEGSEKSGSCEKQGSQNRIREQGKEKGSRGGRVARESTAPNQNRDEKEADVQSSNQEETTRRKPELQDSRMRKNTKYTVSNSRHETPKSKIPKHHDERNTNPGNKELRRRDNLNDTCRQENYRKAPERTHCSKGNKMKKETLANFHGSQAIGHTKSREIRGTSYENTVHREHHNNTLNAKTYTPNTIASKDPEADVGAYESLRNSDRKQREQKSSKRSCDRKSSDKEERHSKRTHKASNLLAGAPRLRQVLSLTPDRHKGRIWAPLNLSSDTFTRPNKTSESSLQSKQDPIRNMNQGSTNEAQEMQTNTTSKERYRALCKSKVQREWEEARLAMLLGTSFKSSNNDQDKKEDEDNEENDGTVRLLDLPVSQDKSSHTSKSHASPDSPDIQHTREKIVDINKSETPKRDHLNSQRPKLSNFTRKIYKIESGLSFARERKDKTPYLDRSFGTPWLGGPIFDTSGSTFSSSRTPTDPTMERSSEDLLGSQGTELNLNTTKHSIPSVQDEEQRENENETEANIKEFGITQSQGDIFSGQYASKESCSPHSVLHECEKLKHNGRTWIVNENYTDLATDPHQYVTHQVSSENNSLGSLYYDPRYSHWLTTHENEALPTQHQYVCQEKSGAEGTSDMANPSLSHFELPLNDTHDSQNLYHRYHDSNSNQSQVMTQNSAVYKPNNEMLTYTNRSSNLVPAQAKQHPSTIPTYHFLTQDYDTNQELEVSMSQGPLGNNPPAFSHNTEFRQYSESQSSSQYPTSPLIQNRMEWQHRSEGSRDNFIHYNKHSTLDGMRQQAVADARENLDTQHISGPSFFLQPENCFPYNHMWRYPDT